MDFVLLYRTAYLFKVKEVGAERQTNVIKSFRIRKIFSKITQMSQRISVMMMKKKNKMMIMIIIIINRDMRAFVKCN
jgi:hypothetical protein